MRLLGIPPDGLPAISYVGSPTGSIVGSAERPIGKIISVPGLPGGPGPANELKIGDVVTGAEAGATITGEFPDQALNLTLPKGDKGDDGDQGPPGDVSLVQLNTRVLIRRVVLSANSSLAVDNTVTTQWHVFLTGGDTYTLPGESTDNTYCIHNTSNVPITIAPPAGLTIESSAAVVSLGGKEAIFVSKASPTSTAWRILGSNSRNKVDKISATFQLYATDGAGATVSRPFSSSATPSAMVQRDASGRAQVVAPSVTADIATKGYVDTADALKVDKVATANRVYIVDSAGATTVGAYTSAPTASAFVRRDANGRSQFADPAAAADAATKDYVDTKVAGIVNSAPATLDTLDELANALGDDPNFATTVSNNIGLRATKSTKVSTGTGLTGGGDLSEDRTLAVDFGTGAGKVTQGNDSRLSDSRTPTAHTHPIANITNLQTTLDAKALASLMPTQITQTAWDALGPGRPARLYAIVG